MKIYNLIPFLFSCDTESKKNAHRGKGVVSTTCDSVMHNFNCSNNYILFIP